MSREPFKATVAAILAVFFLMVLSPTPPASGAGAGTAGAAYRVRRVDGRWAMRDGVKLPVSVFYPDTLNPFDRFPLVVFVHGWDLDKGMFEKKARDYAARGYVSLAYTVRGWYGAEGEINCIDPEKEMKDLSEMITIASADRRFPVKKDLKGPVVGVTGYSMGGVHSYLIAHRRNARAGDPGDRRVRAVVPMHGGVDILFSLYPNGAVKWMWGTFLLFGGYLGNFCGMSLNVLRIITDDGMTVLEKLLAVIDSVLKWNPLLNRVCPELTYIYRVATERRVEEAEWARQFLRLRSARYWCDEEMDGHVEHPIDVPTLIVTGWKDDLFCANEGLRAFSSLIDAPRRIIVTNHGHAGGFRLPIPVPDDPERRWIEEQVSRWFDRYLKGVNNGVERDPRVCFYRDWDPDDYGESDRWPLAGAVDVPLYMGRSTGFRRGLIAPARPGAGVPPDSLVNLGLTGSVSLPYFNDAPELFGGEPLDLPEKIEILPMPCTGFTYETAALRHDVTISGAPRLSLFYECSQPFAQLIPRLYEVRPDGKEVLVSRGWYEGYSGDPGRLICTEAQPVEMAACCHRFTAGSRIRLELETADLTMSWPYWKPSTIRLYHDSSSPSRIVLPVVLQGSGRGL